MADQAQCHRHHHHHEEDAGPAKAYVPNAHICPMCAGVEQEGPGACPLCGMSLEPAAPQLAQSRTEYTCPMHPDVVREAPGDCPICGMALEPRTVELEAGPNPELVDMSRRFWISLSLTLPVFITAMADLIPGRPLDGLASDGLLGLAAAGARQSGRAVGRQAVLRTRLDLAGDAQPQHVHADRDRHRGRVPIQPGGDPAPGLFPDAFRGGRRRRRGLTTKRLR